MGLVQRDGIERLTHVKKYSRFKSTICVMLSDTGFKAGHGKRWGVPATEIAEHSDLVVVWGTNPVHTHVNLMTHIARARKERGAKLVVVDPYRSATAELADMHLALRPGTDGALACGVMHVLFKEGLADRDYLARYSDVPDELERHLRARTPAWASAITGLPEAEILAFARLYGGTKRAFLRLGYGFTRSRNGAAAMHAASCLPVVTGAWQHQGGGALYNFGELYHWDKTMIEGLDARDRGVRELDQSQIGPILAGEPDALAGGGPVHALLIQNTNPMCIAPDLGKVHRGFARDDLFVAVHEQFMTDTARVADIVLPATMFLEHADIYQAGAHPTIQVHKPILEPFAECRTNHYVICELAQAPGCRASRLRHDRVGADRRSPRPLRLARRRDRPRRRRLEHRARVPQGAPPGRLPDPGRPLPLQARLGEPRPARPPDAEAARPHAGRRRADARPSPTAWSPHPRASS